MKKIAVISYAKKMILQIHNNFIDVVKSGRGDKLLIMKKYFQVKSGQEKIQYHLD